MAEHPEHVLPYDRITAGGRLEERGAPPAVERDQEQGDRKHGHRRHDEKGCDQGHPRKQWHTHESHTRATQIDDCRNEVDGAYDRSYAQRLQAESPEVDIQSRRVLPLSQVRVPEPASVWSRIDQPGCVDEE